MDESEVVRQHHQSAIGFTRERLQRAFDTNGVPSAGRTYRDPEG